MVRLVWTDADDVRGAYLVDGWSSTAVGVP